MAILKKWSAFFNRTSLVSSDSAQVMLLDSTNPTPANQNQRTPLSNFVLPDQLEKRNYGGVYVNQGTDYTVTLPAASTYTLEFTANNKNFTLPDMTQTNAPRNPIILKNISHFYTVIIKMFGGTILYTQLLPNQTIVIYPRSWSAAAGIWEITNFNILPTDDGVVPFTILGGSETYTSNSNFKYDQANDLLKVGNVAGINKDTLVINQGTDYQLTNPCPARINASFTTSGCSLITADYNPSLTNLTKTPISIFNAGSETFILKKFGGIILYSQVLPGQTITIFPKGGGADFDIFNGHIAPTDFGVIPFAETGGSYTYTSDSLLKYDSSGQTLYATQFLGVNKNILTINQATDYTLTNPCPNLILLTFTASGHSLIFPDMTEANAPKTPIRIVNQGTETAILKNHSSFFFYTQLLPGQTIDVYPIDWSSTAGSFYVSNLGIAPSDFGGIPFAISGGSFTYKTSSDFTFDDSSNTLVVENVLANLVGFTGPYTAITSAVDYNLSNPCPTIINANFTASSKILRLPDMSQANSLKASLGAKIRIRNVGSNTFTVVNYGTNGFWDVIPNQIIEFEVTSNASSSGSFNTAYSMLAPVNNQVVYGKTIDVYGNLAYTSSANMTFDGSILHLSDSSGGIIFPNGATTLNHYEESGTILLSATGALSTTFIILIKRIGRMAILELAGFTAAVTSSGNKIVSTSGVDSQFRPAYTVTWTIPIIDGASSSTRATGELSLDSSGIVTLASTNGANFTGANAGVLDVAVPYFPGL